MSSECDICGGARVIRVPVRRTARLPESWPRKSVIEVVEMELSHRTYPCPECQAVTSVERVAVLDAHAQLAIPLDEDHRAVEQVQRAIADRLGHMMLMGGYIQFQMGRSNPHLRVRSLVGTIGVVTRGAVQSIEDRAMQYGLVLAKAAVDEMRRQILQGGWFGGSLYHIYAFQRVKELARKIIAVDKVNKRGHHDNTEDDKRAEPAVPAERDDSGQ